MNLSILDRNVIHAFGALDHADEAERVYLAKRDSLPPLASEAAAYLWAGACRVIASAVRTAEGGHDGQDNGVLDFIRVRFLNMDAA